MEQVVKIFQQRLFQLTNTFLRLLNNIEKSKLFTLSVSHCEYRMEYLAHMILTTLQNQQQKTIKKLTQRIQFLTEESGLAAQSQIPQIFARQVQKRDKTAFKTQTITPPSSSPQTRNPSPIKILQKNIKNTSETKVNSFEQPSSESQLENEQSIGQSDQSVMSYKFKYLKIKL